MPSTEQEHAHDADAVRLAQLGYRQDLQRNVEFDAGAGVVDEPPPAPAPAG
jgi:hypothetical protein